MGIWRLYSKYGSKAFNNFAIPSTILTFILVYFIIASCNIAIGISYFVFAYFWARISWLDLTYSREEDT